MNKTVKPLVSVLFVPDLMLANRILTQHNCYPASLLTWYRLIVLIAWLKKKCKNSKNYGGAALYKYKSKYIAKYIRNTLLSCKLTAKKTFDNNSSPGELNIVSNFHTWSFRFYTSLNNFFI